MAFRLVLRTDFNPNYLIFWGFYLKNRTTTKPTPKPFIFLVSAPVAVVAVSFSNPMANDGNSSLGQARTKRLSAFVPRKRERTFGQNLHARFLRKRATYNAPSFRIYYYTKKELQSQANTNKCSYFIKLSTKSVEKIVNKNMLNIHISVDKIKVL